MAKLDDQHLSQVAAALVVAYGLMPIGYYYVGSEMHQYLFHSKDGKTGYMLEFGGGDNPYLGVNVYSAPFVITEDLVEHGFETDDEGEELEGGHNLDQLTQIWELDFSDDPPPAPVVADGTPFTFVAGLSIGNERDMGDMSDWNQQHLDLWALGALAAFLYDLREGKV